MSEVGDRAAFVAVRTEDSRKAIPIVMFSAVRKKNVFGFSCLVNVMAFFSMRIAFPSRKRLYVRPRKKFPPQHKLRSRYMARHEDLVFDSSKVEIRL